MSKTRPRKAGRSLTRPDLPSLGCERITILPRAGTCENLSRLAEQWGCSRTVALERAVLEALRAALARPG